MGLGYIFRTGPRGFVDRVDTGCVKVGGEPRITAKFWYEQLKDRAAMIQDGETQAGAGLGEETGSSAFDVIDLQMKKQSGKTCLDI